uniref:Integron gene cassette protein n=1 Tax=Schistocephalus solidus TaxID=70667 RepID=A0A183SHG1_SCHSO
LRSSTRVSSGFNLRKHSSPSFGSYRARSCSAPMTRRLQRRPQNDPRLSNDHIMGRAGDATTALLLGAERARRGARNSGISPHPENKSRLHFHCAFGFRGTH